MGAGVFLAILGAILTFAVRRESPVVDLQTVGVILMVAGAAIIHHRRNEDTEVREVTTVEDTSDPDREVRTVQETVVDHGHAAHGRTGQDAAPFGHHRR